MKKKFLALTAAVTLILSSCTGVAAGQIDETKTSESESQSVESDGKKDNKTGKTLDYELLKPTAFYPGTEYEPLNINANLPDIKVEPGLSNIENLDQFGNLNEAQREMIEKNGFVVNPTGEGQIFYIYEDNSYNKIPNFITTDSVLQLYHIFYDYALRNTESEKLYTELKQLNKNMIKSLLNEYNTTGDEKNKPLVGKTLAYFALCEKLLNEESTDLPGEIKSIVEEEYANIQSQGTATSAISRADVDYSLFKVRGHYTRSEELGQYFAAMSMYGVIPFNFYNDKGERNPDGAYMSIIATKALQELSKEEGMNLWEDIYVITEFFVGSTDDINPMQLTSIINAAYGKMPETKGIEEGMDDFYNELEKLEKSRISDVASGETGLCFRFMGQRYIPDSEILDRLSNEKRPFPSGLDVMAVLGSKRAEEILDTVYMPSKDWPGYTEEYEKVKKEFSKKSTSEKTGNIYNTWLFTLESLNQSFPQGYPSFMRNTAWEDKSLATSLGSWGQLRHDTILYGAQSGVECGGDEPPEVLGYVEPNPEFYNRLIWMTKQTKEGLSQRGAISESMSYKCDNIIDVLEFLKNCSIKELNGESLTAEEYLSIFTFGGTLEYLSSSIAEVADWYSIESDADKNMAQIADIHSATTSKGEFNYLEVGVGNAAEIYVAVPIEGKLYLTRGGVFDYFEFTSGERLTDEEWQKGLNNPPDRPPFINSYMLPQKGEEIIAPAQPYTSGC